MLTRVRWLGVCLWLTAAAGCVGPDLEPPKGDRAAAEPPGRTASEAAGAGGPVAGSLDAGTQNADEDSGVASHDASTGH
jgi:hypothetical protein